MAREPGKGRGYVRWVFGLMWIAGTAVLTVTVGGDAATAALMAGASEAVTLCLELAGAYLLFMGVMGVAKRAGLMDALSRALSGIIGWLFPRAGRAAGAIALCFSANMLGMGNAATPLGLEAMRILEEQNPHKGIATDEMCIFIAVNGSALQLLPTGLLALRQAAGSSHPAAVVLPSFLASAAATVAAVVLCRFCTRRSAVCHASRRIGVRA